MLDESFPYKEELRRELDAVNGKVLTEDDGAWIAWERFVFWSAFVLRKLAEAKKLSDEFEAERFKVVRYPTKGEDLLQDFMNAHKLETHYDLSAPENRTVDPIWIGSQLVHSFTFIPQIDDAGQASGLYFNSDRSRKESVFFIEWDEFARMLESLANDDVVSMRYNRLTGDLKKWREPPDGVTNSAPTPH